MGGGRVGGLGQGGCQRRSDVFVRGGQVRSGMGVEGWVLVEGEGVGW